MVLRWLALLVFLAYKRLMLFKLNVLVLIILFVPSLHAKIADGIWSTTCLGGLNKEQLYEANDQVKLSEHFYQNANCTDESFTFETRGRVSYYNEPSLFMDFTYKEIRLIIGKQTIIDDFNLRKVCGCNNWQINQPQNITGQKCALFDVNKELQIPKAGDRKYGIFKIENSKLYYGQLSKDLDGSSVDKRPLRLNKRIEYIFQN